MYPMSPETSEANALLNATSCTRFYDGGWKGLQTMYGTSFTATRARALWPYSVPSVYTIGSLVTNIDGSYTLFPIIPHQVSPTGETYGELDGCYFVPGYSNAVENLVVADGFKHLVVQNTFRATGASYWALKLCATTTTTTTTEP